MADEAETAVVETPAADLAPAPASAADPPATDLAPIAAAKPAPAKADPVPKPAPAAKEPPKTLAAGKVPVEPKAGTLAEGGDVETDEVKPDWPTDWREKMAGEDAELQRLAKRFGSPSAILRALREGRAQISKGLGAQAALPEDATEEDKAAWRKARGVPDKPEGYDIQAPEGITWTDEDKVYLDGFRKFAHDNNLPADQVQALSQWYINDQLARQQQTAVAIQKDQVAATKTLKAEWGGDFKRNVELLQTWGAEHYGADGWELIVNSRTPSGGLLGDQPGFIRDCLERAMVNADGAPIEAHGMGGGVSDSDARKAHQELIAKAANGDRAAKAQLADPAYDRKMEAVYDRIAAFEERNRGKAA